MGMTIDNLCKSCINLGCEFQSGIVRTECAFYMPPYTEPDNCGNYVVMQPPKEGLKDLSEKELAIIEEEYISKADYENRLKADMVAMLTELQLEIKELWDNRYDVWLDNQYYIGKSDTLEEVDDIIQQKISSLKAESEDNNVETI